jgi:ABC-2 type transport system ATP-binding protein
MTGLTYVPCIEFDGVTKRYGEQAVVDDLTLTVTGGRIHCLLGPNGAGKTTTMHMLMGLRHPTSGDVRIDGVSVASPEVQAVRRRMGFLADQPDLYEDLTGREFLQFLAELYEMPEQVEAQANMIASLELRDDLNRPLAACSLGVRKKIALLGALVPAPAMLVLDEPTGALDAHAARAVKDLMRSMRDAGDLVLFSTHVMEMAQQLADTISIINAGRLVFSGSLADLRTGHGQRADESLEDIFLRVTARPADPTATARAAAGMR